MKKKKRRTGLRNFFCALCITAIFAFVIAMVLSAVGLFHEEAPPQERIVYDHPVFLNYNEESGN